MTLQTRSGDAIIHHSDEVLSLWNIGVIKRDGDQVGIQAHVASGRLEAMRVARGLVARNGTIYLRSGGVWSEIQMF